MSPKAKIKEEGKKILILEDESHYSNVIKLKLSIEGYQVVAAENFEQFFVELKKLKPNLIILDLILNETTGFDVLEKIRKTAGLKKTKVIIYSSLIQEEDRQKAAKLGVEDYLIKSEITLQELVEVIKKYLD